MLLSFSSTCRKVMNLNVVSAFVVVFRFHITGLQTLILFSGCGIIFTREWWVSSAFLQSTVSVGVGLQQSRWKRLLTHFLTPVSALLYPSSLFSLQSLALIDCAHTLRSACGGIRKRQQRRFWATHVNRKWRRFSFTMHWQYQIYSAKCLYCLLENLGKPLRQNASLCLNPIMISTVPLMQCDIFLWPRQVTRNPVCLGIHSPLCCE